ncbi:MAG: hypothetical protein A2V74_11020 [Acidobacteria bacterium RBG_16_70_10]|nr:MAG: hypothetical protein A2V74_11020 [Acidobacteria bacterium RBG_16_70_10]
MKRKTIFCISSIPNQTIVRGTRAEIGRNRSGSRTGEKKCLIGGYVPIRIPRGIATSADRMNAIVTR